MLCVNCGAPIRHVKKAGGWLHTAPLGEFRLSHAEALAIHDDPPRPKEVLHRPTYIHPAEARGYSVHSTRRRNPHELPAL